MVSVSFSKYIICIEFRGHNSTLWESIIKFIYLHDYCFVLPIWLLLFLERRVSQQEDAQGSSRQSRLELKSRPRPGSFNTGAPRVSRIIAPPPAVVRRNSHTAGPTAAVSASASTSSDLISFNSPSPVDKSNSVFEQFNPSPSVRVSLEQRFASTTITPHSMTSCPVNINSQAIVPFAPSFPTATNVVRPISNQTFFNSSFIEINRPETSEVKPPLAITDGSNLDVLKLIGKQDNSNLIDLNPRDAPFVPARGSVLEAFDPLLKELQQNDTPAQPNDDEESQCSSIYDVYDPFEYMNAPTRGMSTHVEPVYATVNKKGSPIKEASSVADSSAPPPLPPRSASLNDCHRPTLERRVSLLYV